MTLKEWVAEVGGLNAAGRLLKTHPTTIRGWFFRRSTPKPLVMRKIVALSKGRVSFDEIIATTQGVKPLGYGG